MIRRQLFGWLDPQGKFRVSLYPADAPVRPSIALDTMDDVEALLARKRATIVW